MASTTPHNSTNLNSILVKNLHLENHCGQYLLGPAQISENDITHLLSLTKQIKSYRNRYAVKNCSDEETIPIAHSVYLQLCRSLGGNPLMPSLEILTINLACASLEYIRELEVRFPLFLSPSLRYVEIDEINEKSQKAIIAMLASLPYNAPHIRTLKLRGAQGYKLPCASIDSWLDKMVYLESIELNEVISVLHSEILSMIGRLPNLRTFVLRDSSHVYRGSHSSEGFKKLEELHVSGSIELVSDLIQQLGTECFPSFDDGYKWVFSEPDNKFSGWGRYVKIPAPCLYNAHVKMLRELEDYILKNWPSMKLYTDTIISRSHGELPSSFFLLFQDR